MCVTLSTFHFMDTILMDKPNIKDANLRDLIYSNRLVDGPTNCNVLFAFNLSGPLVAVNRTVFNTTLEMCRKKLDGAMEFYDCFSATDENRHNHKRATETIGFERYYEMDCYEVLCLTHDDFKNNHEKYLRCVVGLERTVADAFKKECLDRLLNNNDDDDDDGGYQSKPYIVVCYARDATAANIAQRSVSFVYKPEHGKVILPLMCVVHDGTRPNVIGMNAIVQGVRLTNKPAQRLQLIREHIDRIENTRLDHVRLVLQLGSLRSCLRSIAMEEKVYHDDTSICNGNDDDDDNERTTSTLANATNQLDELLQNLDILINLKYETFDAEYYSCCVLLEGRIAVLVALLYRYIDERTIDWCAVTERNVQRIRLMSRMKQFVKKCLFPATANNDKPYHTGLTRKEYACIGHSDDGTANGFVYNGYSNTLYAKFNDCQCRFDTNLYIDIQ
ncbi:p49 [Leucania separata nucleopolyhedrovirus]|uniref:p49 n=1 Tax=Leucania separata nucleopolyhedrovirus TaxID=1307956 RepID=Q0IL44_NPVLS|nr:p49 [Leucania separata nucleopolyhedrovirus]AAR28839.1 p49 [Leucania separata nucleopolyhedrovirus]